MADSNSKNKISLNTAAVLLTLIIWMLIFTVTAYGKEIAGGYMDEPNNQIIWEIDENYTLTIKPSNTEEENTDEKIILEMPSKSDQLSSDWPWHPWHESIKKAVIIGNYSLHYPISMFMNMPNLESVDFSAALIDHVYSMYFMFKDSPKLNEIKGLENINIGKVWNMTRMFSNTALTDFDFSVWEGQTPSVQIMKNMFKDCRYLKSINFAGFKPVNVRDLSNLLSGCTSLTSLDISGFGKLEKIVSVRGLIAGCNELKTLNMDNLDISAIEENADGGYARVWWATDKESCNAPFLPALETLSAKNSKIWMVKGVTKKTEAYQYWNAAEEDFNGNIPYFMCHEAQDGSGQICNRMWFTPDTGATKSPEGSGLQYKDGKILLNKREWIDLLTNRWTTTKDSWATENNLKHGFDWETNPNVAANIGGVSNAGKIDIYGISTDGHTNTNGAGFLAPGVYERTDDTNLYFDNIPQTFYRVNNKGNEGTEVHVYIGGEDFMTKKGKTYYPDDTEALQNTDLKVTVGTDPVTHKAMLEINTIDKSIDIIKQSDTYQVALPAGGIKIIYKNAATNIYHQTKDVILTVNKITFVKQNLIPLRNIEDESDPHYYRFSSDYDVNRGDRTYQHDNVPHVIESTWFRRLFKISIDELMFLDYLRMGGTGVYALSNGSGSEVEFKIEIANPEPDSKVLFFIDDLDISADQIWHRDYRDSRNDWLPWDEWQDENSYGSVYGTGSEGIILREGNDLDTITFGRHSGLEITDKIGIDGLRQQYVLGTGPDHTTPWSAMYVRADASGAEYTWTSGIGCTTYLLKNTFPYPEKSTDPVILIPEMRVKLNGTAPAGEYEQAFQFKVEDASGIEGLGKVSQRLMDTMGLKGTLMNTDCTTHPDQCSIPHFSVEPTNNGEYVYFGFMSFDVPEEAPHRKAYIYKITQLTCSDPTVFCDTGTVFYAQLIVSGPVTSEELAKGSRVDIFFGEEYGNNQILWFKDQSLRVWSSNLTLTETDTNIDGHKHRVIIDSNGTYFIRHNGQFLKYAPGEDTHQSVLNPTTPVKSDISHTVSCFDKEYEVYIDRNGVEYFKIGTNAYSPFCRRLDAANINPKEDDAYVMEPKMSDGAPVLSDAKGIEYFINEKGEFLSPIPPHEAIQDPEFSPDETDRIVYTQKYSHNGNPVRKDEQGRRYYESKGHYFDPITNLRLLTPVESHVMPLPTDELSKENLIAEVPLHEGHTGEGFFVYETADNIRYYQTKDGKYHTPIGTLLIAGVSGFMPSASDKIVTQLDEIMQEADGTLYYRSNKLYYTYDPEAPTDPLKSGILTTLKPDSIDAGDIAVGGTFNNTINHPAKLTIEAKTLSDKRSSFDFSIVFDNDFSPLNVVFEPDYDGNNALQKADSWSKTNNEWQFTLLENQKLSIRNITIGTGYTIREMEPQDGYSLISVDEADGSSVSGTIKNYMEVEHVFTNQLTESISKKN